MILLNESNRGIMRMLCCPKPGNPITTREYRNSSEDSRRTDLIRNIHIPNTVKGGGIYNSNGSTPVLTNVTIAGNRASQTGGGMYNDSSNPEVRNTIIHGNEQLTINNEQLEVVNAGGSVPAFYYSVIEGAFDDNGLWIAAVGTDGGANRHGGAFFVKSGFDANGAMQAGDYRLSKRGDAVDGGRNAYLWEHAIPKNYYLLLPMRGDSVDILYDLAFRERIEGLYVDMGAYEYEAKDLSDVWILRKVFIPETEGLETDPNAGLHYAISHRDYIITVKAKPGYSLERLTVKTGVPERDKDGVVLKTNDDG
ncbi:MAG: hypothetical protein LBR49_00710, partial [Tannerella sp.]|nr:hypothetical protein [Tannerella sp.]